MAVVWWNNKAIEEAAEAAALAAMTMYAGQVLDAANEIVPLNKDDWSHRGTLQRSGTVIPKRDGVEIKYSVDEPFDYAYLQHWHPVGPKWTHMVGRDWHYLSRPFGKMVGDGEGDRPFQPRFRKHMKDWVGKVLRAMP